MVNKVRSFHVLYMYAIFLICLRPPDLRANEGKGGAPPDPATPTTGVDARDAGSGFPRPRDTRSGLHRLHNVGSARERERVRDGSSLDLREDEDIPLPRWIHAATAKERGHHRRPREGAEVRRPSMCGRRAPSRHGERESGEGGRESERVEGWGGGMGEGRGVAVSGWGEARRGWG